LAIDSTIKIEVIINQTTCTLQIALFTQRLKYIKAI